MAKINAVSKVEDISRYEGQMQLGKARGTKNQQADAAWMIATGIVARGKKRKNWVRARGLASPVLF